MSSYAFVATVWEWERASWHFATLPHALSDEIADVTAGRAGGFGSVRVEVTIGSSVWKTSLFPSHEEAAYVLPLKKQVRTAQGLRAGTQTEITLRLVNS